MKLEHVVQDNGWHRLELIENGRTVVGHGAAYTHPCFLQHNGQTFVAFTAYFDGTPGVVVERPLQLRGV